MTNIDVIENRLEQYCKELDKHDKIINGNGQEGLRSKVSKMSVYLKILLTLNTGILTALIYLIMA